MAGKDLSFLNISIDFGDGIVGSSHVGLDLLTYNKVIQQDPDTLAELKSNYLKAMDAIEDKSKPIKAIPLHPSTSTSNQEKLPMDGKMAKCWNEEDTLMLISKGVEKHNLFTKMKAHKKLWKDIAEEMNKAGIVCSLEQCCNKWKSLKRSYMETVDHNKRSGNDRKEFKYYEEFDNLYGNKESTRPLFTMDTILEVSEDSQEETEEKQVNEGNPSDSNDEEATQPVTPKTVGNSRKRRVPAKSPTVQWLDTFAGKQKEMHDEAKEAVERRHHEKMQRFDRFLDILERNK